MTGYQPESFHSTDGHWSREVETSRGKIRLTPWVAQGTHPGKPYVEVVASGADVMDNLSAEETRALIQAMKEVMRYSHPDK